MTIFMKKFFFKSNFDFKNLNFFLIKNQIFFNYNQYCYLFNYNFNSITFKKSKFALIYNFFQNFIIFYNIFYFFKLNLIGLGFKVFKYKNFLIFKLGYSHFLKIKLPKDIFFFSRKFSYITLYSNNKHLLTNFLSKLYKFKSFNFYKGKGLSLVNLNNIILKIGKQQQS